MAPSNLGRPVGRLLTASSPATTATTSAKAVRECAASVHLDAPVGVAAAPAAAAHRLSQRQHQQRRFLTTSAVPCLSSAAIASSPPRRLRNSPSSTPDFSLQLRSTSLAPTSSPLFTSHHSQSSHRASRFFSSTSAAMVATKLDGNAIAKTIRERIGAEIAEKQKANPRYKPNLKIIQGLWFNALTSCLATERGQTHIRKHFC